jgi:hypothetical protein
VAAAVVVNTAAAAAAAVVAVAVAIATKLNGFFRLRGPVKPGPAFCFSGKVLTGRGAGRSFLQQTGV